MLGGRPWLSDVSLTIEVFKKRLLKRFKARKKAAREIRGNGAWVEF